jgi:hypothetical protein
MLSSDHTKSAVVRQGEASARPHSRRITGSPYGFRKAEVPLTGASSWPVAESARTKFRSVREPCQGRARVRRHVVWDPCRSLAAAGRPQTANSARWGALIDAPRNAHDLLGAGGEQEEERIFGQRGRVVQKPYPCFLQNGVQTAVRSDVAVHRPGIPGPAVSVSRGNLVHSERFARFAALGSQLVLEPHRAAEPSKPLSVSSYSPKYLPSFQPLPSPAALLP